MTTMTRFSEMEMNEAFKRVQNPKDWRAPINCVVAEADPVELEKIREAVEFYTATTCYVRCQGRDTYWVTAVGYRNGPAGP
jgi:hypothetical protein